MTLAEYEQSCIAMEGRDRGQAAGPAYALRRELFEGEPFDAARDRVLTERWHAKDLAATGQMANFATLTPDPEPEPDPTGTC